MHKNCSQVVHIFGQTPHHYLPMHTFLNKVGAGQGYQQQFWVKSDSQKAVSEHFTSYADVASLVEKMKAQGRGTHFIFHGLFEHRIWPTLAFSRLTKRCSWVCWGAEVYQYQNPNITYKRKIARYFLTRFLPRLQKVFSLNKGDGELIASMSKRQEVEVLPYPLIGSTAQVPEKNKDDPLTIVLGNSASKNNQHQEALTWLKPFANENLIIKVPLNYAGPPEYVEEVIETGRALFQDKFMPITQMMEKETYDEMLAACDIAIFAHHRQQGLYVVYTMLKHGLKMFMREEVSSYKNLKSSGFTLFASEDISNMSFDDFRTFNQADANVNKSLMRDFFSEEALIPKWQQKINEILK